MYIYIHTQNTEKTHTQHEEANRSFITGMDVKSNLQAVQVLAAAAKAA